MDVIYRADYTQRCQGASFCGRLFILEPCAHKRSFPKFIKCYFLCFLHLYIRKAADSHMPNPHLQKSQQRQTPSVPLSALKDALCYKTFNGNTVYCCSTQKYSSGGGVVAAGLGFVPFKSHEAILDVQHELDEICNCIKASQFGSIWSASIYK